MSSFEKISKFIRKKDNFLIVSHENPDCDAIGSTLAAGLALKKLGKNVKMYNKDKLHYLEFLPGSDLIVNSLQNIGNNVSTAIVLDCADNLRPGEDFSNYSKNNELELIFIDHHKSNNLNGKNILIDADASSTGIMIYKLLKYLGVEIDIDIAENIFSTIVGDTGSFRYSNTYCETFHIAGELVSLGVDPEKISQKIYENESIDKIKLMGLALTTLDIDPTEKVAFVHVNKEMFELTHTNRFDTEGLVNIPRSIKGIEVAVMLREEYENGISNWKASLRSKDYIDVAEIAKEYGGGGHKKAAGCRLQGSIEDVKSRLYGSIRKEIK
ncbi:MAG: DHH family phosphoesterase [Thermodesulfobacteriota bacterium]